MRFPLWLTGFASLVSVVGCGAGSSSAPPSAPSASLGREVSFSLPSDHGELVTVPISGARATVLDFWAPTCVPCEKSVPALVARRADLEAAGARLVLVAVLADGESTEDARKTLGSWGVSAPFLVDRGGVAQAQAGVQDLPATLVLDAQGSLRWVAPPSAGADAVVNAAAE